MSETPKSIATRLIREAEGVRAHGESDDDLLARYPDALSLAEELFRYIADKAYRW